MKHINDAKKSLELGDSQEALGILDNLLAFSSKNPEIHRLRAFILDSWGRFDESLEIFRTLKAGHLLSEEALEDYETRLEEERHSLLYSRLTEEGRWYYRFSSAQLLLPLWGLLGCLSFFFLGNKILYATKSIEFILFLFCTIVLFPWLAFLYRHIQTVQKILVNYKGFALYFGFRQKSYSWDDIYCAVIEYDRNLKNNYLKLILYANDKTPLVTFDISKANPIVNARRHFTKSICTYVNSVSFLERAYRTEEESFLRRRKECHSSAQIPNIISGKSEKNV